MAGIADMLIGGYNSGHALAKDRKAEADKSALAGLFSQAYASGNPQAMLPQIAAVSPSAAVQAQGHFADLDEHQAKQFVQTAQVFTRVMTPEQRAQAWPGIRAELSKRIPQAQYPEAWHESLLPQAQQLAGVIAQQFGGGGMPAGVQEFQYMSEGLSPEEQERARRIKLGLDPRASAPPEQDYVFQTDQDGNGFWLPKPNGMPAGPASAGAPAPTTGGGAQVLDSAYQGATGGPQPAGGDPFAGLTASIPDLRVTSRTRTPEENAALPNSSPNSYHLTGRAIDIGTPSPEQQAGIMAWLENDPVGQQHELIRNYADGHWHLEPKPGARLPQSAPTAAQGAPGGAIPIPGFRGAPKGRDAPSGYQYAPDGQSLVPIPGGPVDRKENPTPADMAKGEMGLRKELDGRLKTQRVVVDMYLKAEEAATKPSAPNDLALIFAYMKMLDPGSVVREAEFANAQNAAGVPDQIRNAYNRALRGERLNGDQRQKFLESARGIYDVASDAITRQTRDYQGLADEYGYNPRRATGAPDFRGVVGGSSSSRPASNPGAMSDDDLLRALGQ